MAPLGYNKLPPASRCSAATSAPAPGAQVVNTQDPNNPGVGPPTTLLAPSTFALIQHFIYQDGPALALPAPPCKPRRRSAT